MPRVCRYNTTALQEIIYQCVIVALSVHPIVLVPIHHVRRKSVSASRRWSASLLSARLHSYRHQALTALVLSMLSSATPHCCATPHCSATSASSMAAGSAPVWDRILKLLVNRIVSSRVRVSPANSTWFIRSKPRQRCSFRHLSNSRRLRC